MYLLGSVFILLIMGLILIFAVGLPILAAILVYHDANKRIDCSPWLWALAAAFVPCYIGVIIYLIIRKDYPLKSGAGDFGYRYSGNHTESCYDSQYEEGENAGFRYTRLPVHWEKAFPDLGKGSDHHCGSDCRDLSHRFCRFRSESNCRLQCYIQQSLSLWILNTHPQRKKARKTGLFIIR